MSEFRRMMLDAADRIFRDLVDPEMRAAAETGTWPDTLWAALQDNGLTQIAVPEVQGGAGAGLGDAIEVLRLAGRYAAPVPLLETFLAGQALATSGQQVPAGPLALNKEDGVPDSALLSGVDRAIEVEMSPGSNQAERIHLLGALGSAAQMAGVMEAVLDMTLDYVQDRVQFGRPVAKFQAVQHNLAIAAEETAAAGSVVSFAIVALDTKPDPAAAEVEIAAAKARAGEAAGKVAEIVHQAHGAIGFTREYPLHQFTRRLWVWRDQYGGEGVWQEKLGRLAGQAGGEGIWNFAARVAD